MQASRHQAGALALWAGFVAFSMAAMIDIAFLDQKLPVVGKLTVYQALLGLTGLLGAGTLLRVAGGPRASAGRTAARIVIAYLLFELLAVIPVALWLDSAPPTQVLHVAAVRFTWLLLAVMLVIAGNDGVRKAASMVVIAAAVALVLYGTYLAVTGGGGFYREYGDVRFRILYGGATLLFAWPLMLAASGAVPARWTPLLVGVSLLGLTFTNHRTGFIAAGVAVIAVLAMAGRIRRLAPLLVPLALVGVIVAILAAPQLGDVFGYTLSHLFDIKSGNGADRLMRWRLALDFFAARPVNDYLWSWRYYLIDLPLAYEPHNFMLEIGVTEGIAGMAFYGSLIGFAFKRAARWVRHDAEIRALVGYLIAYLVFCFGNASWYVPVNFALLVAGVAMTVSRADQLAGMAAHEETAPAAPAPDAARPTGEVARA